MTFEATPEKQAVIMVVEDEQPIRAIIERVLRNRGHRVIAVGSGDEALAEAARQPEIDLLITDMVMRGMNGRELAMRMQETRPDLRVLYVSGFTQKQTGLDQAAPEAQFLEKPFALDELVERVRLLLAV